MTDTPVVSDEVVAGIESVEVNMNSFTANQMMKVEEHFDADFQDVAKAMTGEAKIADDEGKPIRTGALIQMLAQLKLSIEYPGITAEQAGRVPLSMKAAAEE